MKREAFAIAAAFAVLAGIAFPPAVAGGSGPRAAPLAVAILSPSNGTTVQGDVNITGNASGPEGTALVVEVSIDSGPWYPANGNGSWSWFWSTYSVQDGAHLITARASDGAAVAVDSVSVLVDNSLPLPRINGSYPPLGSYQIGHGGTFTFSITTDNEYSGEVSWSVDGAPVQNGTDKSFTYVAGPNSTGNHSVSARLVAGDPAPAEWILTVLPANKPPVVTGYAPDPVNASAMLGDTVRFNVSAYDPEGRGLTYRWSVDLAPAPGNRTNESIQLSFNRTGKHLVEVVISDGQANRTVSWNITIEEPPTIGLLDVLPCTAYIVVGLFLGIWYGTRKPRPAPRQPRPGME